MKTPTINYTHPIEVRADAQTVKGSNDRQLKKLGRERLDEIAQNLGLDTDQFANRDDLIDSLRPIANEILSITRDEERTAWNDPRFKREQFFDSIQRRYDEQRYVYARAHEDLKLGNAFHSSDAQRLIESGTAITILKNVLQYDNTEMTLDEIKEEITRDALRRCRAGVNRSTSVVHNFEEDIAQRTLAEVLDTNNIWW